MRRKLVSSIFVILLTVVFVTCLCPVLSFADSYLVVPSVSAYTPFVFNNSALSICSNSGGTRILVGTTSNEVFYCACYGTANASKYYYVYSSSSSYDWGWCYSIDNSVRLASSDIVSIGSGVYRHYISSFGNTYVPSMTPFSTLADMDSYFVSLFNPTPEPATPTPTPTPEPATPTPAPTPSVEDYFLPFRSFSGTYYNKQELSFPDSVTNNRYEQYSGIVCNHDMRLLGVETSHAYEDGKVKYLFEYEVEALESATYRFTFLYDADYELELKSIDYLYQGTLYPMDVLYQPGNADILSGPYTVYGAYDIDPALTLGPPYYHWDYDLVYQRSFSGASLLNFTAGDKLTIFVIVESDYMPGSPTFNWSQFFNDTKPDTVFLTVIGGLSSLPFFVSGLSFLALGALIGIILKFMR